MNNKISKIKKILIIRTTGTMKEPKPEDIERRKKKWGFYYPYQKYKRAMKEFKKTIKRYYKIKYKIDEKTFNTKEEAIKYENKINE